MRRKHLFILLILIHLCRGFQPLCAQPVAGTAWIDSVFNSLSPTQRISQLLVIRAYSDRDSIYNDSLTDIIRTWNVGGICFFKGTPFMQAALTNHLQKVAQTPLLIAIDAEWGMGMRLDSAFSFPRQMTLGAIEDDSLIYRMSAVIAKDCKRLGIHLNLAPVVDINNNPMNPVINARSFGENKYAVARKGIAYTRGVQDQGIMAVAKHFPGHGDTDTDSHLSLPVVPHSEERLNSVELYPFMELIKNGVEGIMIAHLFVPAYDSLKNTATTLSPNLVSGLLKENLGFKGFVITDALDMKGVTKYYKPGEIEVKALLAGNDILLLPQDVRAAVSAIKTAVDSAVIPQELIDLKCRRILQLKYHSGLRNVPEIPVTGLYEDLNPVSSEVLNRELFRSSLTLARNRHNLIPMSSLGKRKIAVVSIGDSCITNFQSGIMKYAPVTIFNLPSVFREKLRDSIIQALDLYNAVIIGLHNTTGIPAKNYGISESALAFVDSVSSVKKVILDIFGIPYILSLFRNPENMEAVIVSYEDTPDAQEMSAELIFGGIPACGHLPVTPLPGMPCGTGIITDKTRLESVLPEEIGIPSSRLAMIDSIAISGINEKAYPGCQVLFALDGKVFYRKSFGHPVYGDSIPVTNDDIYDLASVTKVAATALAVMKLYEEGKISLNAKLDHYLPFLKGTNKGNLTIREVMAHQAGLQAWIPFYQLTLLDHSPDTVIYHSSPSGEYPYRVAKGLYIRKDYPDSLIKWIMASPVSKKKDYKYSDLGFYLLRLIIEKQTGKKLEEFLEEHFFKPMGLTTMGFRPYEHFPVSRIIPTENDTVFRKQLLRGDVHDPGAAMLGGVSGHAGLFSNALDLAVILQVLLQGGEYGGTQYFHSQTIREFTRVQFPQDGNRRGLGFDKPLPHYSPDGPACKSASLKSFGHSGFTGTYIWADPENQLVYVFLSNRIYPDASNQKITEMNIRTRIHQAVYDILEEVNK